MRLFIIMVLSLLLHSVVRRPVFVRAAELSVNAAARVSSARAMSTATMRAVEAVDGKCRIAMVSVSATIMQLKLLCCASA